MNKKIFRSSMVIAMLVLIASIALIMGVLFNYFELQLKDELSQKIKYISQAVENEGVSFFDGIETGNERITLISADGKVIFDTAADAESLGDHSDRKEFIEAAQNGFGTSERYSDTLSEKTIYYAVKLSDGSILRISATEYTVVTILIGIIQPIALIIILAVIISAVLSSRISKSIVRPINDIDLDFPENNDVYDELSPLLKKISLQNKIIAEQLKEAAKKQEEFRLITENMDEGFLVIDKDMQLLTYNTSALRSLDIPQNMPVENINILSFNRTRNFREVIEKSLLGQRAEEEMQLFEKTYNLIANPVKEDGRTIGAVIVILDITERIKREQLRREFTSNVSHELKTPLTSISGFAEIMSQGGNSEETVIDFSRSIYNEAQRLISLVMDIIKLSELDEKNPSFEKESVDLYSVSENVINELAAAAQKKNISTSLIGEHYKIIGVRKVIEEMLYNLFDNAIKYNKVNGFAEIRINSEENKIILIVRDTGIGIPRSDQSRVFERFYRVDKGRSKADGGTGLGLSIVKHGAILHNAEIVLESEPDKGTEIKIVFNSK